MALLSWPEVCVPGGGGVPSGLARSARTPPFLSPQPPGFPCALTLLPRPWFSMSMKGPTRAPSPCDSILLVSLTRAWVQRTRDPGSSPANCRNTCEATTGTGAWWRILGAPRSLGREVARGWAGRRAGRLPRGMAVLPALLLGRGAGPTGEPAHLVALAAAGRTGSTEEPRNSHEDLSPRGEAGQDGLTERAGAPHPPPTGPAGGPGSRC